MSDPQVSVLMPVRNGERWLALAIESVLAQTLRDFELLVIDDGSTDRTPEIIAEHAARDTRIRSVTQPSLGLVAALNRGLAEAHSELIARLDADDLAATDRLAVQSAAMDADPDLVLLGSWAETIDETGRIVGMRKPEDDPQKLRGVLAHGNPFVHSSVMLRRDVARELGGYRAAFEAAEDYDLWLRLSEHGEIANIPRPLVRYREHGGAVTAQKAARQLFSTRLAAHAAASRRKADTDPTDTIAAPPDWRRDADISFLKEDLHVLRLLELADPEIAARDDLSTPAFGAALAADLNHRERKLAQFALLNLLRRADRPPGMSVLSLVAAMLRLHPPRAIKLLAQGLASR